jgi:hypothetical protein
MSIPTKEKTENTRQMLAHSKSKLQMGVYYYYIYYNLVPLHWLPCSSFISVIFFSHPQEFMLQLSDFFATFIPMEFFNSKVSFYFILSFPFNSN